MICSGTLLQQKPVIHSRLIPFTPISLGDKPWIDFITRLEDSRSSAWCFANMYFWMDSFQWQVAFFENRLLSRLTLDGDTCYGFPIGEGDIKGAVRILHQDAINRGVPLKLRGLTEKSRQMLEDAFPNCFEYVADTNVFDYIYEAEKLISLSGKKLQSKRNHINRFLENHENWMFEPISAENIGECLVMSDAWVKDREERQNFSSDSGALQIAASNFEILGLEGGLLRLNGDIIAFTIGELLNSDTYIVHFEKAFADIQGAYPLINREFVRFISEKYPQIRYINREEDMGIEALRKAKRSYNPIFMVEKYMATWRSL